MMGNRDILPVQAGVQEPAAGCPNDYAAPGPVDSWTSSVMVGGRPGPATRPAGPSSRAALPSVPRTPSGRDARVLHVSPGPTVSRSADFGALRLRLAPSRSERIATSPNTGTPGPLELDSRNSTMVPQPPVTGTPASASSPRLRSFSGRTLSVRTTLSATQLLDGDDTPELFLANSPKVGSGTLEGMLSAAGGAEGGRGAAGRQSAPPHSLAAALAGSSPRGEPSSQRRPEPTGAPPTSGEVKTDPWAILRAHCMAAYGSNLSSDDEGNGSQESGPVVPMRHRPPVHRSLSRSFGEAAASSSPSPWLQAAAAAAATASTSAPPPRWQGTTTNPPTTNKATTTTNNNNNNNNATTNASAIPPGAPGLIPKAQTPADAVPRSETNAAARSPPTGLTHSWGSSRSGAVTTAGAAEYGGAATYSRPRSASSGAVTQPGSTAVGRMPLSSLPPHPGSSSSSSSSPVQHTSENGTTTTAAGQSAHASGLTGQLPQRQQAVRVSARAGGSGAPAITGLQLQSGLVSFDGPLQPLQLVMLAPLDTGGGGGADGDGGDGGGIGTGDRRLSESGGLPSAGAGSILDVTPLLIDPVRKRRLSADGLSRHASKFIGAGSGADSAAGAGGGAPAPASSPPPAAVTTPGAAEGAAGRRTAPPPAPPPDVLLGAAPGSTSGSVNSSPSGSVSGRAPLITALAYERAPWSQAATAAAATATATAIIHAPGITLLAPAAASGAAAAAPAGAGMKMFHQPAPRVPVPAAVPQHHQQSGVAGLVGLPGAHSPAPAGATPGTVVDKLRVYRSSKVLLGAAMPSSLNIPTPSLAANEPAASSPTAVTGLSAPPTKPKLGAFVSMRSLPTTASSFLDRLSHGTHTGPGGATLTRTTSSRRTIGGGTDWPGEGAMGRSFRRRMGCSLDGSGCGEEDESGSTPQFGSEGDDALVVGPGGGERPPMFARSASHGAATGGPAAGLFARRSYKQLLPRGPNGLPLAWSAIEEEDGREGSEGGKEEEDGGGAGGGSERGPGEEEDDDEEDGFNMARCGGRVDLHQTC